MNRSSLIAHLRRLRIGPSAVIMNFVVIVILAATVAGAFLVLQAVPLTAQDNTVLKKTGYGLAPSSTAWTVFHIHLVEVTAGKLSVRGSQVNYAEIGNSAENFTLSCSDFKTHAKNHGRDVGQMFTTDYLEGIKVHIGRRNLYLENPRGVTGATGGVSYENVLAACATAKEAAAEKEAEKLRAIEDAPRLKVEAEDAAKQKEARAREEAQAQEIATAKRESDLRIGIRAALDAAEEPVPFLSIRGDFDLSGSDSRQWKTSLQLPTAEKCALLKTSAPTPTAVSAWTFGCLFQSSDDGYERIVKTIQSILNLTYRPNEKATGINQVFFANPARPAWRLYVARMNESTIGVSVVAVRVAGAIPTTASAETFAGLPTTLPNSKSFPLLTNGKSDPLSLTSGSEAHSEDKAHCEEYKKHEDEHASREAEVSRLQSELVDLQNRQLEATKLAQEAVVRQSSNCSKTTGALAALFTAACAADKYTSQQKQLEAQTLMSQITLKQSQVTNAQLAVSAFARSTVPPSCRSDGTVIAPATESARPAIR